MLQTADPGLLNEIISTGAVRAPDGSIVRLHSNVSRDEGQFLQRMIREVRPKRSIEIGMAYGVSTLFMCEALVEVGAQRHVAVDPYQFAVPAEEQANFSSFSGWNGIGLENIRRAGYGELVEHVAERSEVALPRLAAAGQQFDFAFIDGYHTFEAAFVDFFYIDRMLRVGGVVVFDDVTYPAVRKVVRFVIQNRDYSAVPAPQPAAFAKSWKRRLLEPLLRSRLKPEIVVPDWELGIGSQFVALRKNSVLPNGDAPYARRWDAHVDF